jgi:hypothetical protein
LAGATRAAETGAAADILVAMVGSQTRAEAERYPIEAKRRRLTFS